MTNHCFSTNNGQCREQSTVAGNGYRISVLTPQLLRLEYDAGSRFEDHPTRLAVNRSFPSCAFQVRETAETLELHTEYLSLFYDKKPFSGGGLSVKVRSECAGIYSTWHYGDPLTENLFGTARTLDQADGAIPLEPGIQSRLQGFSVLDDSDTILLLENGQIRPRRDGHMDLYFFGYGFDYKGALRDYFHLTGATPLLPRWALGNWWSRFYAYTAQEYQALMERFSQEQIPLSVSVVDMDWHITDVDPKDGKGWTGYTWNRRLFPDPPGFLQWLHDRGLKVTLNLHPAEGIQPHEDCYAEACSALGRDPSLRQAIPFDFEDPDFRKTYFDIVLRPLEQQGVDFWWVDWQQGDAARYRTDPLWLLNHYHFLASGQNGSRPITFSRYAGPGSHRYPIGFSGDSIISWESLQFQPYFTATAANIGYGWWSHDIGGHCGGSRDEELTVRWLQFGVFSPILRLHSTSNLFNGKEPWRFSEPAQGIMKEFLRLRHRLIPYLYTANWQCHRGEGLLVQPMYYDWPACAEAYEVPNQYTFGSELIVCPITAPQDEALCLGCTTVWLPDSRRLYYDFFTGMRYRGGRRVKMYRSLQQIPVLARAGALVPLAGASEALQNGAALPTELELRIFAGDDGQYTLYEDDGQSQAFAHGEAATTEYRFQWHAPQPSLSILPGGESFSWLPPQRRYTVTLVGVQKPPAAKAYCSRQALSVECQYDSLHAICTLKLPPLPANAAVTLHFPDGLALAPSDLKPRIDSLLNHARISYELKDCVYKAIFCQEKDRAQILSELMAMELPKGLLEAVCELLLAE